MASLVAWMAVASAAQFCPQDSRTVATAHAPFTVRWCDLNRDGYADLVTANADTDDLSIMLNRGDGTFAGEQVFPAGNEPVDVDCCDLNGDGDLDVITGNRSESQVNVFINLGGTSLISLAPPIPYAVGLAPWGARCIELNGDSRPDVVTSNFTGESVSVLVNSGNGTLGAATDVPTGADGTYYLATCDLDGDRDDDVLVSNLVGRSVTSFRNDGNGTLTRIGTFSTGAGYFPWGVACCDLNGDAKPDAVAAISGDDLVVILFNDGAGRFDDPLLPSRTAATGDQPFKVTCCNLDHDDDLDLLTANLGSNDVSVLENPGDGRPVLVSGLPVGDNVGMAACSKLLERGTEGPGAARSSDIAAAFVGGVEAFLNVCAGSGDVDGDGEVDLRDVGAFTGCMGREAVLGCAAFDFNGDQRVELPDFAFLRAMLTGPRSP